MSALPISGEATGREGRAALPQATRSESEPIAIRSAFVLSLSRRRSLSLVVAVGRRSRAPPTASAVGSGSRVAPPGDLGAATRRDRHRRYVHGPRGRRRERKA